MLTRREVAIRLDIPPEMAARNGIPARLSEAAVQRLDAEPPPWLAQSRANRPVGKPVWIQLTCDVCGWSETVRPKKWWPRQPDGPAFTYLYCADHDPDELPAPAPDTVRGEYPGVGSRLTGVLDEPLS